MTLTEKRIAAAIENNNVTQEIQEWAEQLYRMNFGTPTYCGKWTVEQHIAKLEKMFAEFQAANAEPTQVFNLTIDFNDLKSRNIVKALGGRWNADTKTWRVECKKSELSDVKTKSQTQTFSRPSSRGSHWGDLEGMFGASAD